MIGLVVKLVLGIVLFAGSLVGGLAATGRLNHEGTANIPVLSSFFPPPPPPPEGEAATGEAGAEVGKTGDAHGAPQDAAATPAGETQPADASHDAQDPQGQPGPRKQKTGRSLVEPEGKPAAGGHGEPAAGHGEAPKDEHGKDPHAKDEPAKDAHADAKDAHGKTGGKPEKGHGTPEGDFQHLESSLANGKAQYTPGELFRFQGLPAGVTPEQINEAWQRVQGLMAEIERKKLVLDQQEQQLRELSEDISRRQSALKKEANEIEQMHRQLDAKIARFQEQVKMVRTDEVAALKRNATTIASWERAKAAELLEQQWKSDKGQDEVLKLLEFMDKDAANEILDAMPLPMAGDIMKKRQRVSKEPAAPAKGG